MKIRSVVLVAIATAFSGSCFSQTITGTFAIKNVETGIFLRIKDADTRNGTPIVAYSPVNWKCVTWDFKKIEGNAYQLANLYSGKTFQPKAPKAAEGTVLEEQPLTPGEAGQQYEFIPAGKDDFLIRLKGTDLYLTPSDDKGTVNAPVMLTRKNNSKLLHWSLQEQHPVM
ncbi:RICIN domain-containing protein [Chitinophaga sp. HK235]|uniref:RICIN domain-containing protein n=1 Tax=Chitinophaga sp. HK235 TaxID=2952571 RepID=UPI001BA45B69|nr:RICIN domain-containing protein [Chitinophaga sp. HK235]